MLRIGVVVAVVVVAVVVRPVVVPRLGRLLPARLRFAPPEFLHEVVEHVAHRRASLAVLGGSRRRADHHGRCRPSMARRNADSTVSASSLSRIVATRAGSNRNAARMAAGARQGRVGSSGGAMAPSRELESPGVLEDEPRQGARDRRPESGERRIRRRPGGRRQVAERDDALVVGDPEDRQPPAVGRLGRTAHPGAECAVADTDLVLAHERRAGRRKAFGHGRRIAAAPRSRPRSEDPKQVGEVIRQDRPVRGRDPAFGDECVDVLADDDPR